MEKKREFLYRGGRRRKMKRQRGGKIKESGVIGMSRTCLLLHVKSLEDGLIRKQNTRFYPKRSFGQRSNFEYILNSKHSEL